MITPLRRESPEEAAGVQVNLETLTMARLRKGMTMSAVAKAVGHQTPWMSKIEKGSLRLSPADIANLAGVLDVPVAFLAENIPTADPEGTHFRTLQVPKKVSDRVTAQANIAGHLVNRLMQVGGQQHRLNLPQIDVRTLRGEPAQAARYLREHWGIDGPFHDLVPRAEAAGIFLTTMDKEIKGVRGATVRFNTEHAHTLIAAGAPDDARRHTIAHEIAHLIMDAASGPVDDKACEARADQFAGELLAPYEELRPHLRRLKPSEISLLFDLQQRWGVSPVALVHRARLHDDISPEMSTRLYRILNSHHKRALDTLPSPFPVAFGAVPRLLSFLRSHGWAEAHVATVLRLRIPELEGILDGWAQVFRGGDHRAPSASVLAFG